MHAIMLARERRRAVPARIILRFQLFFVLDAFTSSTGRGQMWRGVLGMKHCVTLLMIDCLVRTSTRRTHICRRDDELFCGAPRLIYCSHRSSPGDLARQRHHYIIINIAIVITVVIPSVSDRSFVAPPVPRVPRTDRRHERERCSSSGSVCVQCSTSPPPQHHHTATTTTPPLLIPPPPPHHH